MFLFEILGDAVGVSRSYWVLIVVPLIPLCLYIVYCIYTKVSGATAGNTVVQNSASESDIELQVVESSKATETDIYNPVLVHS